MECITELGGETEMCEPSVWQEISVQSNTHPARTGKEKALGVAGQVSDSAERDLALGDANPGSDRDLELTEGQPQPKLERGVTNRVTLADGRAYDVYVPSTANADKPMPLVVAAHGAVVGDPTGNMETETGFNQMAEEKGFIVAYPLAKVRTQHAFDSMPVEGAVWSTPYKDLNEEKGGDSYDDLKYVDALLSDLKARPELNIDSERIYATGFSDGARMLELYAATRPQTFAALSAVHGTLLEPVAKPENGLPVMLVHGTGDDSLPLNGGKGYLSEVMAVSGVLPGTDTSDPRSQFTFWAKANNAPGKPTLSYETRDGEVIGMTSELLGQDGPVKQTVITGADHAWHGRDGDGGHMPMGARDLRYQTSREVWNFMSKYRRRDGAIQNIEPVFQH